MHGFQLWANLPSALKMTAPRYQEVKAGEIPEVVEDDGTRVRVICGDLLGSSGPVDGIAAEPSYLDVSVPPGRRKSLAVETTRHAFAYVFAGSGRFGNASEPRAVRTESVGAADSAPVPGGVDDPSGHPRLSPGQEADNRSLVLFDTGDEVTVQAGDQGIRFLLVSGRPIQEPVAWYGPIVMNTQEELQQAFAEYQAGTFLKHG